MLLVVLYLFYLHRFAFLRVWGNVVVVVVVVANHGKTIEQCTLDIGGAIISTTHSLIPVKMSF